MYLSLSHGFLFIHVPKAAGSSIRTALADVARPRNRTGVQRVLSHLPIRQDPREVYFRLHDTAHWARVKLGQDRFEALRRYAVVRNPYDMAVSYFRFYQRYPALRFLSEREHARFPEFLDGFRRSGRARPQCHWLEDRDGELLVPNLLFFESLEADFARFTREVGLSGVALGLENVSGRGDYRPLHDTGTRAMVEEIYARDFARWHYDFQSGRAAPAPLAMPA